MKIKIILSIPVPPITEFQTEDELIEALRELLSVGTYLTVEVFVHVVPE